MNKSLAGFEDIKGTVLAGLAVAVVFLLALAGLSVPLRECLGMQRRSEQLRARLAEVETLYPLYLDLSRAAAGEAWDALPRRSEAALSLAEVVTVPDLFSRMASEHDMELASIHPHVVADVQGQRRLQVELEVKGPYEGIKPFLLDVAGLPSAMAIKNVEVRREELHEALLLTTLLALSP
jgi:Tfp pilus assembly protein PilO